MQVGPFLELVTSCGEHLLEEGELGAAKDSFFATGLRVYEKAEPKNHHMLACRVRMLYGVGRAEIKAALHLDPTLQYPLTLTRIKKALKTKIQVGLGELARLPESAFQDWGHLMRNGTRWVYETCDPLLQLGFGGDVAECLAYALFSLEAVVNLSTARHIKWRIRYYTALAKCYEQKEDFDSASGVIRHGRKELAELKESEELDPPLPKNFYDTLKKCHDDLSLMEYRQKVLAQVLPSTENSQASDMEDLIEAIAGLELTGFRRSAAVIEGLTCLQPGKCNGEVASQYVDRVCAAILELRPPQRPPPPNQSSQEDGTDAEDDKEASNDPADTEQVEDAALTERIDAATAKMNEEFGLEVHIAMARELFRLRAWNHFDLVLEWLQQRLEADTGLDDDSEAQFQAEARLLYAVRRLEKWEVPPPKPSPPPTDPTDEAEEKDESVVEAESVPSAPSKEEEAQRLAQLRISRLARLSEPQPPEEFQQFELPEVAQVGDKKVVMNYVKQLCSLLRECATGSTAGIILVARRRGLIGQAALALWDPYLKELLAHLDSLRLEYNRYDDAPVVKNVAIEALGAIHHTMLTVDLDDPILRATVALRLGVLLADEPANKELPRAIQILRSGMSYVESVRRTLVLPDVVGLDERELLTKTSITIEIGHGEGDLLGCSTALQTIAALQTDIVMTLFRCELKHGREISLRHGKRLAYIKKKKIADKLGPNAKSSALGPGQAGVASASISMGQSRAGGASQPKVVMVSGKIRVFEHEMLKEAEGTDSTETRLLSECRKNYYYRALLLIEIARTKSTEEEKEARLQEAYSVLLQAGQREEELLKDALPSNEDQVATAAVGAQGADTMSVSPGMTAKMEVRMSTGGTARTRAPPSPVLVARTDTAITLWIPPFNLRAKKGPSLEPAYVCIYAKAAGAGTDVSLNNTEYPGTGTPIPYPPDQDTCVTVKGLTPNDSYVFALAAFDGEGQVVGSGIGITSKPVEAITPLSSLLVQSYLAQAALEMDMPGVAQMAAKKVVGCLTSSKHQQFALDLHRGWVANPHDSQLFRCRALKGFSREVLQGFVVCTDVLVDRSPTLPLHPSPLAQLPASQRRLPQELAHLVTLRRLTLGLEAALVLQDAYLISNLIWRVYLLLRPLLEGGQNAKMPGLLQILMMTYEALGSVPLNQWDTSLCRVWLLLTYQLTMVGSACCETEAVQHMLLSATGEWKKDNFDVVAICGADDDGEAMLEQQLTLYQLWQGLPEYADKLETPTMRGILGISVDVEHIEELFAEAEKDLNAEAGDASRKASAVAASKKGGTSGLDSRRETKVKVNIVEEMNGVEMWVLLVQKVGMVAKQDARQAWEVLNGVFAGPFKLYGQFAAVVLRLAINQGYAQEVSQWLHPETTKVKVLLQSKLSRLTSRVIMSERCHCPYVERDFPSSRQALDHGGDSAERLSVTDDAKTDNAENDDKSIELRRRTVSFAEGFDGEDSQEEEKGPTELEKYQLLILAELEYLRGAAIMNLAFANNLKQMIKHGGEEDFSNCPLLGYVMDLDHADGIQEWEEDELLEDDSLEIGKEEPLTQRSEVSKKSSTSQDDTVEAVEIVDPFIAFNEALVCLSTGAVRAKHGEAWVKMKEVCALMWNAVLAAWVPPRIFSKEGLVPPITAQNVESIMAEDGEKTLPAMTRALRLEPRPFVQAAHALLDYRINLQKQHENTELPSNENVSRDTVGKVQTVWSRNTQSLKLKEEQLMASNELQEDEESEDDMDDESETSSQRKEKGGAEPVRDPEKDWMSSFIFFAIKALHFSGRWQQLVDLAARVPSELEPDSLMSDAVFQLAIHAQSRLADSAAALLKDKEQTLAAFDREWEVSRSDVRRKKARRVQGKSEEELAHEEARTAMVEDISSAKAESQIIQHRLEVLRQQEKDHQRQKNSTVERLTQCRRATAQCLSLMASGRPKAEWSGLSRAIITHYRESVLLLREKRETLLLMQALHDLGDFQISVGATKDAKTTWQDALDTLFKTMDSHLHWREIYRKNSIDSLIPNFSLFGCLLALSAIIKLSKYCYTNDSGMKLELGLMSVPLIRGIFAMSFQHPQKLSEFAVYTPSTLCSGVSLFGDFRMLSIAQFVSGLQFISISLLESENEIQALPVLSLLEHLSSKVIVNAEAVVQTRVLRVHALSHCGFMAEAFSVLASILQGQNLPQVLGGFAGFSKGVIDEIAEPNISNLPTFGLPPFNNHLPPEHPDNAAAVEWLCGNKPEEPDDLPPPVEVSKAADDEEEEVKEVEPNHELLILSGLKNLRSELGKSLSRDTLIALCLVRARLAVQLACSEGLPDRSNECYMQLKTFIAVSLSSLQKLLLGSFTTQDGASQFEAYVITEGMLLRAKIAVRGLDFRHARQLASQGLAVLHKWGSQEQHSDGFFGALATTFEEKLESSPLSSLYGSSFGQWLRCKYLLAYVALKQGRLEDCIVLCNQGHDQSNDMANDQILSRKFKLIRAEAGIQEGNTSFSEALCDDLVAFSLSNQFRDLVYVRILLLFQSIKRGRALGGGKDQAASLLKAAVSMLLEAERTLLTEAHEAGWLGTCPLTYEQITDNLMGPEINPALRYALNGNPLAIRPFGIPVDEEPAWAPSPLTCLYYDPVLILCDVRLQLANVLMTLGPLYTPPSEPEEPEVTGFDEDKEDLETTDWRVVALEKVAEGLATLRHTTHPPSSVRAGLLLALGQLRLALLKDSLPDRLSFKNPEISDPDYAEADSLRRDFDATKDALLAALRISCNIGSHNFVLMRRAAYYLAMLYGHSLFAGEEGKHLQTATHYLRLAGEISSKCRTFQTNIAELSSEGLLSEDMVKALPKAILQELPDPPTARSVLHLLASTNTEKSFEVMEWNLYYKQCLIHQGLRANYRPYAEGCCVVIRDAPEEKPTMQSGLVCIQWQVLPEQMDHRFDAQHGLFSKVQAMVLLGGGANGSGGELSEIYGEDPYLTKIDLKAEKVQEIQRNISDLLRQCRILNRKSKGGPLPSYIINSFKELLQGIGSDFQSKMKIPNADSSPLFNSVNKIECSENTLLFLQRVFDTQNGINDASESICFWLRISLEGAKSSNQQET